MARMRKKLGAVLVGAGRPEPDPHRLRRRWRRRRTAAVAAEARRSTPAPPPARSTTGCGTTPSCRRTRACADAFKTANPNVNVKITQFGWDDYWSKLTNGFVAGDAPDVFTNHLSKYPEFVTQQQLVAAGRHAGRRTASTSTSTSQGLADLWKGQDGKRYGLPKDFDTIALFYNKKLVEDGGVDASPAGRA